MNRFWIPCVVWLLSSCIGTDVLDDPIVPERIEIQMDQLALLVGESSQLEADYFNQYGIPEAVSLEWSVQNTAVAGTSNSGEVTALGVGQTYVFARFGEAKDSLLLTVAGDINAVANITIGASTNVLAVGQFVDMSIQVTNVNGDMITGKTITWSSNNESVAQVNSSGRVTAIAIGAARITAMADGVVSNEFLISVGGARTGAFMDANGYMASGTAVLKSEGGTLTLELSSDFMTSFALGTFIYLSNNNSSGATVKANGLEIKQITMNGAHTFNITMDHPNVQIDSYNYVIVLCKPAAVIFGVAALN